jgi:hypothetical protein
MSPEDASANSNTCRDGTLIVGLSLSEGVGGSFLLREFDRRFARKERKLPGDNGGRRDNYGAKRVPLNGRRLVGHCH